MAGGVGRLPLRRVHPGSGRTTRSAGRPPAHPCPLEFPPCLARCSPSPSAPSASAPPSSSSWACCPRSPPTSASPCPRSACSSPPTPSAWSWERPPSPRSARSEEHTSELQSRQYLVCRLLLEKKKAT